MPSPLSDQLRHFLEHLEIERGRSLLTVRNYQFYLERFLHWLSNSVGGPARPADITQERLRNYRLWLNRLRDRFGKELSKSTQNYHLIALRSFLKYLAKVDVASLPAEKIELAKVPERQVSFLEAGELERLLEAPLKGKVNKLVQHRDKAILELLFSTGLRVSELCGMKQDQINLERDEFSVRGKGGKLRVVFLSQQARYWLKAYLKLRQDVSPYLFVSHDRAAKARGKVGAGFKPASAPAQGNAGQLVGLTPRSVQRTIEKYARAAGIMKNITPHTLRHTYATDLLQNGADLRSVQSLLGHSSVTTTQIYTHVTNQQLREVHQAFHGRKRRDGLIKN